MFLYLQLAPAFWQLSQRRFMACAAIVAACGVISFIVGYIHRMRLLDVQKGWIHTVRRIFEILALSIVYASTLFLMSYMLFSLVNSIMGKAIFTSYIPWIHTVRRIFEILALSIVYASTLFLMSYMLFSLVNSIMGKAIFTSYIPALTAAFAGVSGYLTFVQAELMNAKTLSALLPFFVIAGVSTASSTTTDPHWFRNNFSELGDRTTFAARMFNTTLILGGICIIIITYFAISELIATYRIVRPNGDIAIRQPNVSYKIPRFKVRITILTVMLVLSGVAFIGIGTFRYTPHPILHNVFARGMPVLMFIMLVALPWLAPQLSKAFFAISDLAIVVCALVGISWLMGNNTLTNVEALAAMLHLRPRHRGLCARGHLVAHGQQHTDERRSARRHAVPGLVHRILTPDRRDRSGPHPTADPRASGHQSGGARQDDRRR